MTARSKGHHEIPKWLLKHFCWDNGRTLWMGFKDTREVKAVVIKDATDLRHSGVARMPPVRKYSVNRWPGTFSPLADCGTARHRPPRRAALYLSRDSPYWGQIHLSYSTGRDHALDTGSGMLIGVGLKPADQTKFLAFDRHPGQ